MPFSHRASETIQLLKQMTPDFIPPTLWPPKSPHLNPKEYAVWGIMQFTKRRLRMSVNCVNRLWRNGNNSASMWLTMWWDSGAWARLRGCVDADGGQLMEHSLWLTFWLPQWTSLSFLSVWLPVYCIDCIATCSALYSLSLIRLFIAKNVYYIFHKV